MKSDRYASYEVPGYYLVNNVWNDAQLGTGQQSINQPQGKNFSWNWSWGANPTYVPVSYPSVIFGNKPWDPQNSSTKLLPRQVSQIKQLNVTHDYAISSNGRYNVAYDLWLTEGVQSSKATIRVEIMVWIESSGNVQPYGKFVKENEKYSLYVGEPEGDRSWHCYSFKLKQSLKSGVVNLGDFIQQLVNKKLVSPNLFVADVEFGTELWDGKGEMNIKSYQVSVT